MRVAGHRGAGPFPLGTMAACTLAVLLAHLLLLDRAALSLAPPGPVLGTAVFTTRTLRPPAPAVVAATPLPVAARTPPPAPRPSRSTGASIPAAPSTLPPAPPITTSSATPAAGQEPEAVAAAQTASPAAPEPAASAPAPAQIPAAASATASTEANTPPLASAGSLTSAAAQPQQAAQDNTLPARTYAIPGSVLLRFNATGQRGAQPQQASGSMEWQHDGQQYAARMEIGAFGLGARTFTSTGAITAHGLAPQRFADRRRSEVAAHFDRERARVVFSANTPTVTLQPGAQDQLSVFVQLASLVGGEPQRFTAGTQIALQTVGPRNAETWTFTVENTETLQLPGGELSALKLVRQPSQDYDQKVELWLAPALSWLPARIRISFANGDFVDQQWRTSSRP